MMLWEVEIHPATGMTDREGQRVLGQCRELGVETVAAVRTARSYLLQGDLTRDDVTQTAASLLVDAVVETFDVRELGERATESDSLTNASNARLLNVLYKPGVTDNVAETARKALVGLGVPVETVATCRKFRLEGNPSDADIDLLARRALSNDAIEQVVRGPLEMDSISVGSEYTFQLITVPIREMSDAELETLSRDGQLYLNLVEMQTIQSHFRELDRDATDVELESLAQTWSEHCSHKTLAGRIRYRDENGERLFENMLKETIFAATMQIRQDLGEDDWCVSVFKDNAGIVTFDERQNVCFKVETHNHPSALEPYGGANTGLGGVIRDPLGTGLGAKPVCNTDVFCFAPPDTPHSSLPPGVLHPKTVARGVVSGVRDYGNRMGIPTVNGAVFFDARYLGNPLVYCGNVAMIPVDKCEKHLQPGDLIVAVGGRTGRDGIHGATFSSAELTEDSETISGGAVQIGNAITEKMVADVILQARDENLYSSITDCGAGGFSSAVGEMGEDTGAEVWLDRCPLKYAGLSYTEIWISEAQERMVLSVPKDRWDRFHALCSAEGVEATVIGEFTNTKRLVLKYHEHQVADLTMSVLHNGRPPVIREAVYSPTETVVAGKHIDELLAAERDCTEVLQRVLASPNVASKEWIIRQYDHEVQAGSVVKPLVGVDHDGPSDAAIVRPDLRSRRGLVISNGMNPRYGDHDPYWMAASAIDEAIRNCVAVGADPNRIAILDNFCWGNTDRPEVLGSLVRAAIACQDVAVAFGTPFISGKDSLYNEFAFVNECGERETVVIPSSLLISALGQIDDIETAVTMDLKQPGSALYLVGKTHREFGGSHYALVRGGSGGQVPKVDTQQAPAIFRGVHRAIVAGHVLSCHDLSEGGLAVAAAEMAFAGGLGAEIDLAPLSAASGIDESAVLMFSESNTRFLFEVASSHADQFEAEFADLPCTKIGVTVGSQQITIRSCDSTAGIKTPTTDLKRAWKSALNWD
ncbi:MAG: phosphoribosylformylglycinamidine synthase subunit PurL [Planctomycetota bacterium]|nr:phosphoribosylformylglycinamidine synthase subunit PurL [Planctomycetota bacterium]